MITLRQRKENEFPIALILLVFVDAFFEMSHEKNFFSTTETIPHNLHQLIFGSILTLTLGEMLIQS